jgi:hypothetical protein
MPGPLSLSRMFPLVVLGYFTMRVVSVAEEQPPSWQDVRDKQPAGVHLVMTLPKTRFHMGEVITATLSFEYDDKEAWHFSGPSGGRSGRVTDVAFRGQGEDGAPIPDPLDWYFKNDLLMGGGGGTQKKLEPGKFSLAANQWLQFEKPGSYKLYAWSSCLTPGERKPPDEPQNQPAELVSDPVTITIDPLTADEEQRIIAEAMQVLAGPEQGGPFDPRFDAMERLRFLQTPAARDALLQLVDGRYREEAEMAFYGRPDYAGSAAHILTLVRAGRLGLSDGLLYLYGKLKSGGLGDLVGGTASQRPYETAQNELFAAAQEVIEAGGVSEAFFADLFAWFRRDPHDPKIRLLLIERQLELPQRQIDMAFGRDIWRFQDKEILAEKDFLPLIRELAKPERHNLKALAALATLAPDEARPIIVDDIRLDRPVYIPSVREFARNVDFRAFTVLPDRELPELDAILREKLARDPTNGYPLEGTMMLIDRFATKALLPDVVRVYQTNEGHWQCALQTAALRYWVRCDPAAGVEAVGRALKRNGAGETGCYHTVLTDVLEKAWVDEALPIVLEATSNVDPEVVGCATRLLLAHAGPEAVEKVVIAIEREAAILSPDAPANRQHKFVVPYDWNPNSLTNLLLGNNRWTLTRPQLERLLKVATDPALQAKLKSLLDSLSR